MKRIKHEKPRNLVNKWTTGQRILLTISVICFVGGVGSFTVPFIFPEAKKPELVYPEIPTKQSNGNGIYSHLTGLEEENVEALTKPTYCVQTPNGLDGARPQAGLGQAGVIFEAIAEAGITRFAAIYQNPTSSVIGPIRSLRIYYLEWDTPFDCTVVHAGGADNALSALKSGGYRDLTEDYAYMYRGTYQKRLWNNLFTTGTNLAQFNNEHGYNSSNVNGFKRMTPELSKRSRIDSTVEERLKITEPTDKDTSKLSPKVSDIKLNFGSYESFNVKYVYDSESNSYLRFYGDNEPHNVYACPTENMGERNPEDICSLKQLSPSVVVVMVVQEKKDWDGYHEDITTTGSGKVYIFQNGIAISGTWKKESATSQITFWDESGKEIDLSPGQTFVEAIPNYGGVEY
ncbi:MAG: DUF3048 domain-containing protein [Candidatus Saccharibacteria bacterium]|nr:DUF3048 domain-containing protein [Candidatus Saccharibacteria bacterium]